MNNYHLYEEEGRGKYSVVYKGRKRRSLEYLAIKRIQKNRRKKVQNEVAVLGELSHPNVVKLHSWVQTKNHFWLVLEYCPGGDLLQMIEEDKSFPEASIRSFLKDIVQGLNYCHSVGFVFVDLKPANLLVNEFGVIKLADFGAARKCGEPAPESIKRGTPFYMAPELFLSDCHSFQSDFWALGCLMYELGCGNPPFVSGNISDLPALISKGQSPRLQGYSSAFNDLLSKLMKKDPAERPKWGELIQHPWWKPIDLSALGIPEQPSKTEPAKSAPFKPSESGKMYVKRKEEGKKGGKKEEDELQEDSEFAGGRAKVEQISKLLEHSSDTAVKPIIGNKDIERVETMTYRVETLPFPHRAPQEIASRIGNTECETYLQNVCSGLQGSQDKINILLYFEQILQNSIVANYLIKSQFVPLFIRMLKTIKSVSTRAKVCEVLGLLIRHATVIEADFAKLNLHIVFLDLMKDKAEKVRRRSAAALGEYLFYAATQLDEGGGEVWDIPNSPYSQLFRILKGPEEETVKFYILKTIENISAQSDAVGHKLASTQNTNIVLGVYLATKNEALKQCCLACLHHLAAYLPNCLESIIQRIGLRTIEAFVSNLDSNPKSVQFVVTMLNSAAAQDLKVSRQFWLDHSLMKAVLGLVENASVVVRGKSLIFCYFMLKKNPQLILLAGSSKLFQVLERIAKEGHRYIGQVLQNLLILLEDSVPFLLRLAQEHFARQRRGESNKFGLVLQSIFGYLSSQVLSPFICTLPVVEALFGFLDNWEDQPQEDSRYSLFSVYQLFLDNNRLVVAQQEFFAKKLLTNLVGWLSRSKQPALRFNALKLILAIISQFLREDSLYDSTVEMATLKHVQGVLLTAFLPLLPSLLQEKEPVPATATKLLALLLEKPGAFVSELRKCKLLGLLLNDFEPGSPRLSQHTLRIIERLTESKQLSKEQITQHQILQRAASILFQYNEAQQDVFYQTPLNIIHLVLSQLLQPPNLFDSMQPPQTLTTPEKELNANNLVRLANLLVQLGSSQDQVVAGKSAESLAVLLWAGVSPTERKWQAKQIPMLKLAVYWARHYKGQLDQQTLARLTQRNMKP